MYNSKLTLVLKNLSIKEIKKLYDFVESPFFSVPKEVVRVFLYIQPYIYDWEHENWQKEQLFAHLYPTLPYHPPKINKILSQCLDAFEQFYCIYHQKTDSVYTLEPLFDFYSEHQLSSLFDGLYRAATQKHTSQYKDTRYYHEKWELEKLLAYRENNQYVRQEMQAYVNSITSLEAFFVVEQLRIFCQNCIFKSLFANMPPNFFEERVLLYIEEKHLYEQDKVIKLYWLIYKAFKGEYQYYTVVLDVLNDYKSLLSPFEIRAIYSYLIGILMAQRRSPDTGIRDSDVLLLYKHQLESGFIYDQNGNFPPGAFKNMVSVGLKTNEEKWVWNFITEFEHRLPANMQKEVSVLCKSLCYFADQNYAEVLKLLNTHSSTDVFFNINTRRLWIRTYAELGEEEMVLNHLNTFNVYVHRSQKLLSPFQKESNIAFVKIMKKLLSSTMPNDIHKVKKEWDALPTIAEREWLEKMMEKKLHEIRKNAIPKM